MAGGRTTLSWDLHANVQNYVSGMKKASASTESLYKATKKAQREQELMGKAARLVGAGVALAFGKQIVNAASDMNETMSKTSVVFGKSAARVQRWGDTAAKSMGMSKRAALESAGTLGNLLLSMGNTSDAAANMSTTMVQLAADIGSFNNVDAEEVLLAMRSALTGEIAPMRRFGVNLTDLTIKAKAMELGLYDGKGAIDVQAKSAASYQLILEQTTTAQGDFARTADGLANSQKTLSAEWQDAQVKLGENLLPTVTSATKKLTGMLEVVNDLPAPVRDAGLAVAALGVASLLAGPNILRLKKAMEEAGMATGAFGKVGKGTLALIAAIAATHGIAALGDQSINAGRGVDALKASMMDTSKPIDDLGFTIQGITKGTYDFNEAIRTAADPGPLNSLEGSLASVFGGLPSKLGQSKQAIEDVQQALIALATGGQLEVAKIRFEQLRATFVASGGSAADFDRVFADAKASIDAAGQASGAAAVGVTGIGTAASKASGDVKSLKDAMDALNGRARSLTESKIALVETVRNLAKGLRENGTAFNLSTKAGRENLSNLIETTRGIEDMGTAIFESNKARLGEAGARDKASAAMREERRALIDNIAKLTGSRDKAKELVDKYLKIPKAASDAAGAVHALSKEVKDVPATKTVTFKITAQMTAAGAKALAIDKRTGGGAGGWNPGTNAVFPASGGLIRGPGTGTSDSIPAMVSNGEFVMRAAAVKRYGPEFFHSLNFADGGLVDTGFKHKKKSGKSSSKSGKGKASTAAASRDWSIRDALRDGAELDFDFSAYGSAVERAAAATRDLADADRGVAEARRRANAAGTPAERADAERDVAAALATQAAAGKELAAAEKAKAAARPTGRNILAGFRARAAKLDRFRRDLKTLRSWGLSGVILRQLLDAGIDDGGDMAAALVKDRSVIADLNATQAAINKDALALNGGPGKGSTGGGGGGSTGSSGTTGSSGSVAITFTNAERPIVLKVDGEQVWKSLLHLKKSKGGASLGLG